MIVLDPAAELTARARIVCASAGARVIGVRTAAELAPILATLGEHDLLVINLDAGLPPAEVAEVLRRHHWTGRSVVLVDDPARADLDVLGAGLGAECVKRPGTARLVDELLRGLLVGGPGADASVPLPGRYGIIGRSRPMQEIFAKIEKVAPSDTSVCIYGESGTGKELIAYAIHRASPRRDRPFVPLDCTAIPEGLMESQLFGHVKGAFTGAVEHREGIFSLAHTGTLFIDELCELSLPLQAKLLRVVQTREFVKVGGTRPIKTNVRLITATNKDPRQEVERGTFREDLYYRLAVVMIKVPPLRERKEDIPLLVEHFIRKFATVYRKPIRGVDGAAMQRILSLPWPGNVRELENVIEQGVVLSEGDLLTERDLFGDEPAVPRAAPVPGQIELELGLPLREVERRYILGTLRATGGNRSETARRLGISLRCLQYKLKAYLGAVERQPPPGTHVAAGPRQGGPRLLA
jgi:DNA-binding NtrC family response regulator